MLAHHELGVQRAPQALERQQRLQEEGEIVGQQQAVLAQEGGDVSQERAEVDAPEGGIRVAVDQRAAVGAQLLLVGATLARPVQQDVGDALLVARDERRQEIDEFPAAVLRQTPDHPEVDQTEREAVRLAHQDHVARVRIGVERPLAEHHRHHGACADPRDLRGRGRAGLPVRHPLAEARPLQVVLHAEPFAREPLVHARNDDLFVPLQHASESLGVRCLLPEVELRAQRAGDLSHQALGTVGLQLRQLALRQLGEAGQQSQVRFDRLDDSRSADLEDHARPVLEAREVHLGDRCRSQRFGVELAEGGLRRSAQVFLELFAQLLEGKRGDVLLEQGELLDPLRRQQVASTREDLPELHERRTECLERLARMLCGRLRGESLRGLPVDRATGAFQHAGQSEPAHDVAQSVPHEDARDLVEATQVSCRRKGFEQHGGSDSGRS